MPTNQQITQAQQILDQAEAQLRAGLNLVAEARRALGDNTTANSGFGSGELVQHNLIQAGDTPRVGLTEPPMNYEHIPLQSAR